MGTHSSVLAWEIPWIGEPSGLQSMGLQRVPYSFESEPHIAFKAVLVSAIRQHEPACVYIHSIIIEFPSRPCHHGTLNGVRYALQPVLMSYLFYTWHQ